MLPCVRLSVFYFVICFVDYTLYIIFSNCSSAVSQFSLASDALNMERDLNAQLLSSTIF